MHIVFLSSNLFSQEFTFYRLDKVNRFPLTLTRSRETNYSLRKTTILLVVDEVIEVADARALQL